MANSNLLSSACLERGTDYMGNDVGSVQNVANAKACKQECRDSPRCNFFTFVRSKKRSGQYFEKGTCFMKHSDGGRRPLKGYVSGSANC